MSCSGDFNQGSLACNSDDSFSFEKYAKQNIEKEEGLKKTVVNEMPLEGSDR